MKTMKGKGRKLKEIPAFKNEDEEREFWSENDSTDYVDWDKAEEAVFPNLKPSTQTISIRLPVSLLDDLRSMAHQLDVPYQSLIKVMLDESVKHRFKKTGKSSRGRMTAE